MKYVLALFLVIPFHVTAAGSPLLGNETTAISGAVAGAYSSSGSYSSAEQAQGQLQGQLQGQHTAVSTTGPTVSTTGPTIKITETVAPAVVNPSLMKYEGGYEIKNTPGIALGSIYPTAPCMGSSQVGGSGPGFSIGIGTSWKDDDCGIRETARSFYSIGLRDDAIAVLCTSEYAKVAPSCLNK
jgi:hypothetical protein